MLTVTIIIPCFTERRWDSLLRAVQSAWDQTFPCQLIVVVDHNERLLARLQSEIGTKAQVVPNSLPQGASGARNTGALIATSELVAFLEDDAAAEPTWIEALVRAYRETPRAVGFGGAIKPIWSHATPTWFPAEFSWAIGATPAVSVRTPVRNVWGGNMLVRRGAFLAAEGFRTGFGKIRDASQPEDTELCLRMTARAAPGSRWLFVPDAVVFHEVPIHRGTGAFFLRRCWSEGRGKHALWVLTAPGARPLDDEAVFVRTVLTRGLLRNLAAVTRGDPSGLARASAIVLGTAAAATGFVVAVVQDVGRRRWMRRRPRVRDTPSTVTPISAAEQEAVDA
jgi:glucosyl-dolichyl phosphate glucuronosyltransferase